MNQFPTSIFCSSISLGEFRRSEIRANRIISASGMVCSIAGIACCSIQNLSSPTLKKILVIHTYFRSISDANYFSLKISVGNDFSLKYSDTQIMFYIENSRTVDFSRKSNITSLNITANSRKFPIINKLLYRAISRNLNS